MPTSDQYPTVGSDLALLCRSINEGWDLKDSARAMVVARLTEVVSDPSSTKRDINRASQALVNVDKLRLAAAAAAKTLGDKAQPAVIIQQVTGKDTLSEFLEKLTPDQATQWLNTYGPILEQFTAQADSEA